MNGWIDGWMRMLWGTWDVEQLQSESLQLRKGLLMIPFPLMLMWSLDFSSGYSPSCKAAMPPLDPCRWPLRYIQPIWITSFSCLITITIPPPHKHHCTLLGMHRHYKRLPTSSHCLAVGEYQRVNHEFLRVVEVMHIEYIALSTQYHFPLGVNGEMMSVQRMW